MEKQLSGMNAFVAVHLFQPTGFSPANCFLAIEEALIAHNGKDGDDHKGQTDFFIFGLKEDWDSMRPTKTQKETTDGEGRCQGRCQNLNPDPYN